MNHTKGPWRITLHKAMATLEKDCMPGVELSIATIEFHRGKEMDEANARLIASAPDLLEACKAFMEEWHSPESNGDPDKFVSNLFGKKITASISKAIIKAEREV